MGVDRAAAALVGRSVGGAGGIYRQVMNLTDVDDKIIRRAQEQKKTIREVTEPVSEIFHADRAYLRIESAEAYPKATDYIPQMIALVQTLAPGNYTAVVTGVNGATGVALVEAYHLQ